MTTDLEALAQNVLKKYNGFTYATWRIVKNLITGIRG